MPAMLRTLWLYEGFILGSAVFPDDRRRSLDSLQKTAMPASSVIFKEKVF